MEKIPLVVCVVKECHSNGLGDISIVIKVKWQYWLCEIN